jgi:hypothetical protein
MKGLLESSAAVRCLGRWAGPGTALVLVGALASEAPAQVLWAKTPAVDGRSAHAMAYDSSRARVVLFGGSTSIHLSETCEWDGSNWSRRFPSDSPPARSSHAMAYDSARSRVVVFGGRGLAGLLSDTWEWDGTNWVHRSPGTGPTARSNHAMATTPRAAGSCSSRDRAWPGGSPIPGSGTE